jgi:glycosyltransferase involved in cell wall biosynthesis
LPIVQYDLTEGRRSAEDSALYAHNDDPKEFAKQITRLLEDEGLRKQLGSLGRRRIEEQLNWNIEKKELLRAYEFALGPKQQVSSHASSLVSTPDRIAASSSGAGK